MKLDILTKIDFSIFRNALSVKGNG